MNHVLIKYKHFTWPNHSQFFFFVASGVIVERSPENIIVVLTENVHQSSVCITCLNSMKSLTAPGMNMRSRAMAETLIIRRKV